MKFQISTKITFWSRNKTEKGKGGLGKGRAWGTTVKDMDLPFLYTYTPKCPGKQISFLHDEKYAWSLPINLMDRGFFSFSGIFFFNLNSTALEFHIFSIYFTVWTIKHEKFRPQKSVSFRLEMLTLKYIEWKDQKEIEIEWMAIMKSRF